MVSSTYATDDHRIAHTNTVIQNLQAEIILNCSFCEIFTFFTGPIKLANDQ